MARLKYLLFVLAFLPLNAANASNINQQGADELKKHFQALLDYQKTVNEALGSVKVEYQGELTVTPEQTYYSAVFPRILIKGPSVEGMPESDAAFDVGVIKINAAPDEKPGYWKTVMTFPSKMTLIGTTPEENFTIMYDKQQSIGLFSGALGYFTKMDINLSDITFEAGGQDLGVNIGGIQAYMKMEEVEGENRFTGPGHLLMSNLSISPKGPGEKIQVGELKADFAMDNIKMPTLQEYQDKIMKHVDTFQSLQSMSPEQQEELTGSDLMDMMMDLYEFDLDGFSFKYSAKDLNIQSDMNNDYRDFDSLMIGAAALGFGFDDIQSDSGDMNILGSYNSVKVAPEDPEYKDVIPQSANINIQASKIPYGQLTKIATNTARAIAEDPQSAQMAGLGVIMRLPAILAQAGTQIDVENNGVKSSLYDLSLNGQVLTDLSALTGFTAQFNAVFEGLDALLAVAKKNAANEESQNKANFVSMSQTLEGLKAVGKAATGPNGKPAYSYEIQATPDGKFLVNGQDAQTVFSPAPPPQ